MVRFRVLVAWLVFLALPLQAVAAVSMTLCGPGAPAAAQAASDPHGSHPAQASHHGHHGHHGDHGPSADTAGTGPVADLQDSGRHPPTDDGHRCTTCAFCGHALVQPAEMQPLAAARLPSLPLIALSERVPSRGLPVPDKPPRA